MQTTVTSSSGKLGATILKHLIKDHGKENITGIASKP